MFGVLARDGVGTVMSWASAFTCQDASATPKTSPLSYVFAVYVLVPPDNAVSLTLWATTDMRVVTEDPTTARYFIVKALTETTFNVGLAPVVYVAPVINTTGTLQFRFATV